MSKLSISIIAHNEEENLADCLKSILFADEIIVIDCDSTDKTNEIAHQYTDKVFWRENTNNLNINKSYGFEQAISEWILYLDADERITSELAEEIYNIINSNPSENGFYIPRKNFYFGVWLANGGNYPDNQLRVFRREKGKFACEHVHEKLIIDGKIGNLKNPMEHYPYHTISQYLEKLDFYTTFEAEVMLKKGIKINFFSAFYMMVWKPDIRFLRRYFFKGGFLDGLAGFLACAFDVLNFIVRYAKYWELKRKK